MNFADATTDDLLNALPADRENDRWELKNAELLTKAQRRELKTELGKQVSAFANSGGGYLVFGISNGGQIEPCEQLVGRQPMKDFLSVMVEQSVEYPIRHFRIHRIPLASDASQSVFVVEIEDSPAAPHQAKDERIYYYRIDGHSKPAPHFHVELLRSRMTKSVLEVQNVDYRLQTPGRNGGCMIMDVAMLVAVKNMSMQCASTWGVHAVLPWENYRWSLLKSREPLSEGICVVGEPAVLLPGQREIATIHIRGHSEHANMQPSMAMEFLWEKFGLVVQPVSQNHIGKDFFFGWQDRAVWLKARERLSRELAAMGYS